MEKCYSNRDLKYIKKFRQAEKCCGQWNIFKLPEAKDSRESSRNWRLCNIIGTRRTRETRARHEPGGRQGHILQDLVSQEL